ncbi:MAG: Immunity protein 21 [Planctomycetota bacterium]|nr:Immunity protein 21 [Planctomycetota bacterium]
MLLPEALLGAWHGVASSDYDRACEAAGSWMASLSVNGGIGLLLGGDPGMALLIPDASDTLKLVRWHYADEEAELIEFALRGEAVAATEPDFVFENECAAWVMFNAAADPLVHRPSMRSFMLPVSRVRVTTVFLESERNAAIVHAFRPDA